MSDSVVAVNLRVNGTEYPLAIAMSRNLLGVLRNEVGLTGTKEGCDDCECGACMVLLDGQPVNSCSYLAVQAQGRQVTTVEGLVVDDKLHDLQRNVLEAGGVQCGFCTPGMLMSACALLERNPTPTREEIQLGISGNLCRCTGYARIIDAIERSI
ncbi:MAG: (2Fe-2S)-binding protein [Acidimicrobiaceae bacterium]|jgi:aerobic-type carbon monoxide dehydrogenase small subunit (CoxS/CutS family)|nr:(2Fe-2S)-binding protein [Acidimicrobiaceae bacterium]MBT6445134.1 (2Fe-2S)-binding protein [Acidimicrobiaceae bacterium]